VTFDRVGDIEVLVPGGAELGEGPVWDVRDSRLGWVDILGKRIHRTDPSTGETESIETPLHVGAVAPRAAGGFVAALQDGFWIIGDGPARRVATVSEARLGLRFNDGKADPAGRFWAGTMEYAKRPGTAALYRLDGPDRATNQVDDATISNGLAWSADARTMFYIDTPTRTIDAFDFDPSTGSIANRRTVVSIEPGVGGPDGMTIDAEGGLWVALWGGSAIRRYVDGALDRVVVLPVMKPTSCAFGGPDLDELYVTSAWEEHTAADRRGDTLAGAVLRLRPRVRGVPPSVVTTI
jgi:sugar lactone lactonase YvrE